MVAHAHESCPYQTQERSRFRSVLQHGYSHTHYAKSKKPGLKVTYMRFHLPAIAVKDRKWVSGCQGQEERPRRG